MRYLVNSNSPESAGLYDDATAYVLLNHSEDGAWHEADPATGEPLPVTPPTPTGDQSADPTNTGESADNEGK